MVWVRAGAETTMIVVLAVLVVVWDGVMDEFSPLSFMR